MGLQKYLDKQKKHKKAALTIVNKTRKRVKKTLTKKSLKYWLSITNKKLFVNILRKIKIWILI